MTERWLPVVDYEDFYEVSDHGKVKTLRSGKILAGRSIKGYIWVALYCDGKRRDRAVHILMLEAFVGPCPPGHESFHVNDVQWDNRIINLRWDTHSANVKHSRRKDRPSPKERVDMIMRGL